MRKNHRFSSLLKAVAAFLMLTAGFGTRAQYITISHEDSSPDNSFLEPDFEHTMLQTIYLYNEIGKECTIHAIAFHHSVLGDSDTSKRMITMYLNHTRKRGFESTSDWVTDVETPVYEGLMYLSGTEGDDWVTLELDVPFEYNGVDNLLVTIFDNSENTAGAQEFYTYQVSGRPRILKAACSDYDAYTLHDLTWLTGDLHQYVADMRLFTSASDTLSYIQVGDGNIDVMQLPTNGYHKYSATSQIYTSEELGGGDITIYGVQFYQNPSTSCRDIYRNVKVYCDWWEEQYDYFEDTHDWPLLFSSDEPDFKGNYTLTSEPGWRTIWFDQPFINFDGTNLIITIIDNSDDYEIYHDFRTHQTSVPRGLAYADDYTPYDYSGFDVSETEGQLQYLRNNARFITAVSPTAGIKNVEEVTVSVYPNPTRGIVNVAAEGLQLIEVMDIAGRVVAMSTTERVDLTGRAAGVYTARIVTERGTAVRRIALK